jgi:cellulose biosynthesis protein BcsQ
VVTFDQVLPKLLRVCETMPDFAPGKAVVVRDLLGRVRLAIDADKRESHTLDTEELEQRLSQALPKWFETPILRPSGGLELSRLCASVLSQNAPWRDAVWEDPVTGDRRRPPAGRWHLVERHLSKTAWVGDAKGKPPWPLVAAKPAVVTFYSFKGGVGRTTLVASSAWHLATQGKRVVIIDLDVEAPGVSSLLGAQADRGVLDFVVDHAATKSVDLDRMLVPARELGDVSPLVEVVPAGNLDSAYFEKLARLDYAGSGLLTPQGENPVRSALLELLRAVARLDPRPDYILLDSRAGLHDVAGLSLHDLAHVDVLVGRDSDQNYRGLELTVEALGRRRSSQDLRAIVVQTMAPEDPSSPEFARITAAYRARSHAAFVDHVYSLADDSVEDADPVLEDESAAHFPLVVRFNSRLVNFMSLASQRSELFGDDFERITRRLVELCTPEVQS